MKEFIEEYLKMKESYNKLQLEKHNKYIDAFMKAKKEAHNYYIQDFEDIESIAEKCLEEENKNLFKSKSLIINLKEIIKICSKFKD